LPVIICSTVPAAYTKIQSTDLSIHHHPKVYQLTQQSTTLYESLVTGEYEF
jgi:hypothetical protein